MKSTAYRDLRSGLGEAMCSGYMMPDYTLLSVTRPKIIGISGGSGSGKTAFAYRLKSLAGEWRCSILHQDSYYFDQRQSFDRDGGQVNFDHPDSIDFELLSRHLTDLKVGKSVQVPVYDYKTHSRLERTELFDPRQIIILEGILVLSQPMTREILDVKVFIDAPERVRFSRRIARDARERGRHPVGVEQQFFAHVKPMHDLFVEPSRDHADWVYSGEEALDVNARDLLMRMGF